MKYTIDDLERDIGDYVTETASLRKSKGKDYGGEVDVFAGLRVPQLGTRYVVTRVIQKCCRVLQLLDHPPACQDESLEREFQDIFNFAVYMPILHKQEKENGL